MCSAMAHSLAARQGRAQSDQGTANSTPSRLRQLINATAKEPTSKHATCNTNNNNSNENENNFELVRNFSLAVWVWFFGFLALVVLLALDLTLGASALYLPQRRAFINVPRHMQNKTLTLANAQRDSPAQGRPSQARAVQ